MPKCKKCGSECEKLNNDWLCDQCAKSRKRNIINGILIVTLLIMFLLFGWYDKIIIVAVSVLIISTISHIYDKKVLKAMALLMVINCKHQFQIGF